MQNCDTGANPQNREKKKDIGPKRRFRKKNNFKNIQKSGKTKRWIIIVILRGNVFRYLHFKDGEQFPSEVTRVHYSMKVS
jgi:hypothetical protein